MMNIHDEGVQGWEGGGWVAFSTVCDSLYNCVLQYCLCWYVFSFAIKSIYFLSTHTPQGAEIELYFALRAFQI